MEVLEENLTFLTWQQVLMWIIGGVLVFYAVFQLVEYFSMTDYFRDLMLLPIALIALLLFIMPMVGVVLLNVMIAAFLIVSGMTLLIEAICMRKINL